MGEVILQNVSKVYTPAKGPDVRAVQDFSLQIQDGELMVLVGPSGSGKTTVLRLIAGLEELDAGSIRIQGQVMDQTPARDRDVAMVFQNHALFPHLTVRDNLALGLRLRRVPAEEARRRVAEAARSLRIEDVLDRRPRELSGGQRQRTALGRALVRQPRVFLLDEPLSNLDGRMREETRAEIARLHARLGVTMIHVTHDQTEAMTLGHRLCVMNQGRVMQVGKPLEVYANPGNLFVAGFIGSPGMNLLPGRILDKGGRLIFCSSSRADVTVPLDRFRKGPVSDGQDVVLGIRAENIGVSPVGTSPMAGGGFAARIEVRESLGHETLLHLNVGSHTAVARCASSASFVVGQEVGLRFDPERVRLFDPQTHEVIA